MVLFSSKFVSVMLKQQKSLNIKRIYLYMAKCTMKCNYITDIIFEDENYI